MSIQIHTATREESNNRAMLVPESRTKSGIILRAISLGLLEILRQLANPCPPPKRGKTPDDRLARFGGVSAHAWHIPFDRRQSSIIYCGE